AGYSRRRGRARCKNALVSDRRVSLSTSGGAEQGVLPHRYASAPAWRAVDGYFSGAFVHEDAALVEARDSGAQTTMPHAEVAANQGAFLALLARIQGARRVLEFGTLAGYSTIWLARAVGVGGRVTTLELEEQNAAV